MFEGLICQEIGNLHLTNYSIELMVKWLLLKQEQLGMMSQDICVEMDIQQENLQNI